MIREAIKADAAQITAIYNYYIKNTVVTFEEVELAPHVILGRMQKVQAAGLPWLVAEENGVIIGYAYASQWHERSAFKHTVEVTVYLSHKVVAKGWGTSLYEALFAQLKEAGVHVAIGVIALTNASSVALHEKFAMTQVGRFDEVGYKFGRWLDIGYWQVVFD